MVKLKAATILIEEISFKFLTDGFEFITNKKRWSGHLPGKAMRTIPEEDHGFKWDNEITFN